MSTIDLNVAIYANGNLFKHWALFVDGPTKEEKVIFNAEGSSTRFRYETRQFDPDEDISEVLFLCRVASSDVSKIKALAESAVIHNEAPGYNCQDYVLELMSALEEEGVIDKTDKAYRRAKRNLRSQVEGLT